MTAKILAANNAASVLAAPINSTAATLTLATTTGELFPSPTSPQYFVGTISDEATGLIKEIVQVTARDVDTLTIVRAQEGTTAVDWPAGALFGNYWTAGQLNAVQTASGGISAVAATVPLTASTAGGTATLGINIGSGLAVTGGALTATGGGGSVSAVPVWQSGSYYRAPSTVFWASDGGVTDLNSQMTWVPIFVPNTIQLKTLSVRFGGIVYDDTVQFAVATDTNGIPDAIVVSGQSYAISSANVNSVFSTNEIDYMLTGPAIYWIGYGNNIACSIDIYISGDGNGVYGFSDLAIITPNAAAADAITGNAVGYISSDDPRNPMPANVTNPVPNTTGHLPPVVVVGT
jgi:hypothetical protein